MSSATSHDGRSRALAHWLLWFGLLALATLAMVPYRSRLDKAHVALAFLLVVLGGSAASGRVLGLALAGTAFLLFDTQFLPPYNKFVVADPFDWIVLVAFLVTSAVAAELLERQRREALRAQEAEALRRTDQLKDALLAAVSHDLRTPLTAIKGIASEVWNGGDPMRAQIIEQEADRLNHLVDDLLELSQLNAGGRRANIALNTADDVVGAALERVEAAHGSGRIIAEVAHDGAILVGAFDFAYTMRALTNVLENAMKYSPPGAPITLRCFREGADVVFRVEDAGSGIAPEDEPRIFESFYRGHGIPDGVRGTGLGLSIARQLAEAQGGSLDYAPRPGGGSRFTLRLPAGEAPPE